MSVSLSKTPGVVRDLLILRAGPQDLPHSEWQLGVLALVSICAEAWVSMRLLGVEDLTTPALQATASIGVLLGLTFLLLRAFGREARFVQTASALLATGLVFLLLAALAIAPAWPLPKESSEMTGIQLAAGFASLVIVSWQLLVRGHILRHTLEVPLRRGVLFALALTLAKLLLEALIAQLGATPA